MSTENSFASALSTRPKLALIAGPTASGKSDCAVRLALLERAAGREAVVINADSTQVYADLQVLSARPTEAEMRGVPHRLFGDWDAATACSAADWATAARAEIDAAQRKGALPILVGGTGLYLRTLLDGIAPVPAIDPAVRETVRAMPVAEAHVALARADPDRAAVLNPNDTTRIARSLEVVRSTGRRLADWQGERTGGIADRVTLAPLVLLPPRPWLYVRCDTRFSGMLDGAAANEVRALMNRKLDPALPVMRAIGVREVATWLAGETTREQALTAGRQATRNYAKRQYTWFNHQLPANWPRWTSESCISNADLVSLFQK
jgi:tRNA dimethylallyltransferase